MPSREREKRQLRRPHNLVLSAVFPQPQHLLTRWLSSMQYKVLSRRFSGITEQ